MLRVVSLLGVVLFVVSARAREYSPRVLSPHNADAYSMKTFAEFSRWRGLKGDRQAYEMYKYLVDVQTGLFHMNEVREGVDGLSEMSTVRDPVKIINVYGYAYCGILGPVMAGVCEQAGIGAARTLVLPDWNHVAAETFYDGGWHYLDIDVRAVFRRSDGVLASMADAQREQSLWKGRGPLFFPNDPLDKTREIYRKTPVHHYHDFYHSGHTMDYVLRQGESFVRWWKPQGGRWHHLPVYHETKWLRDLIEQEPRGPKPNHRHFTVHNYGNGRFVYHPNLTDQSTDFADGAYDARNVCVSPDGLTLERAGEGYAIWEVRTPYVIVPLAGKLQTRDDDCEASVVDIDARRASLSVSLDNGISWQELPVNGSPAAVDLTRQVSGGYGYLLKAVLRGRPGEAVVRRLRITTWVQVAPASLPALRQGFNRMQYCNGDHYGLPTRVVDVRSDTSHPAGFFSLLVAPPADYDPDRRTARIRGEIIAKAAAPPRAKIAWFTAHASFRTHLHDEAKRTRNTMAYAVSQADDFQEIYRSAVPLDTEHWHHNAHEEIKLDAPAERVFVRYVGDPALNQFCIYAHCLDDELRRSASVIVTHVWKERGVRKTKAVTMSAAGDYEIVTESEPENESVEIAIPSGRANS